MELFPSECTGSQEPKTPVRFGATALTCAKAPTVLLTLAFVPLV